MLVCSRLRAPPARPPRSRAPARPWRSSTPIYGLSARQRCRRGRFDRGRQRLREPDHAHEGDGGRSPKLIDALQERRRLGVDLGIVGVVLGQEIVAVPHGLNEHKYRPQREARPSPQKASCALLYVPPGVVIVKVGSTRERVARGRAPRARSLRPRPGMTGPVGRGRPPGGRSRPLRSRMIISAA